jgi:preprotein translocase subunit YajC
MAGNAQVATTTASTPINTGAAGIFGTITPMLLMFVAFYFLLMRPQQKREAKRKSMIDSIKKDDMVVVSNGIIGKIHKIVNQSEISLEISEGVNIRVLKSSISEVLDKKSELVDDKSRVTPTSFSADKKTKKEGKK